MKDHAKDYDEYPCLRIYDNPPPEPNSSRRLIERRRRQAAGEYDPPAPGTLARRLWDLAPKPGALPSPVDPLLIVAKELGVPLHSKRGRRR
jgi:hypothetical protein